MKSEKMLEGITEIRDAALERADAVQNARRKPPRRRMWFAAVAAVLVLSITAGLLFWPGSPAVQTAYAIAEAQYPEMAPYPLEEDYFDEKTGEYDFDAYIEAHEKWMETRYAAPLPDAADQAALQPYFARSIRQFLQASDGENRVFAPTNVYMALAMLAEVTDGDSRAELLSLLGTDDLAALREQAARIWNANYIDDGVTVSRMANSVWLSEGLAYRPEPLQVLADAYYASSFEGPMGSDAYDQALQNWLNEQTNGLLEEQVQSIGFDPQTVLALASTVCLEAKWEYTFYEGANRQDVFHAEDGDVTCEFMYQENIQSYYVGEQFAAVSKEFADSGRMWFLLPDEGVSVDALLDDEEAMAFLLANGDWEKQTQATVQLSVPKFDVTSQLDLIDGLQALGVNAVFDGSRADFSPVLPDGVGASVSRVLHDARVLIDEEGCKAAAYTVITADGAFLPGEMETVAFTLDRPFLFVITGADGLPMFVGVVNQP